MRIISILLAILIGLMGVRLFFAGLQAFILFFKVDNISVQAKQTVFKDLAMGILLVILAIAMLT